MYKHWIVLLFSLAISVSLVACAQQNRIAVSVVTVSEVQANPFHWNAKTINLRGYVEVNRTTLPMAFSPLPRLFGSRADAVAAHKDDSYKNVRKAIDLAPVTRSLGRRLQSFDKIVCVVLTGKFNAYQGMAVGIGNFESDTGMIEVSGMRRCTDAEKT